MLSISGKVDFILFLAIFMSLVLSNFSYNLDSTFSFTFNFSTWSSILLLFAITLILIEFSGINLFCQQKSMKLKRVQ